MNVASARSRIISFLRLKSKRANKHCAAHLHDSLEKYFARVARDARVPLSRLSFIIGRPCSIAIRPGTGCDTARDAASWRSKGGVKKRFTTSFRRDPFSIYLAYTAIRATNCTSLFSFSRFRRSLLSPLPSRERARTAFDSRNPRETRITEIRRGSKYRRYSNDLPFSIDPPPLNFKRNNFESCDFFFCCQPPCGSIVFPWIEFVSLLDE